MLSCDFNTIFRAASRRRKTQIPVSTAVGVQLKSCLMFFATIVFVFNSLGEQFTFTKFLFAKCISLRRKPPKNRYIYNMTADKWLKVYRHVSYCRLRTNDAMIRKLENAIFSADPLGMFGNLRIFKSCIKIWNFPLLSMAANFENTICNKQQAIQTIFTTTRRNSNAVFFRTETFWHFR